MKAFSIAAAVAVAGSIVGGFGTAPAAAQGAAGAVGISGPPPSGRESVLPKTAPGRLPRADAAQFDAMEQAPSPAPGGVPGLSSTMSNGKRTFKLDATEAPEAFGSAKMPFTTSRVAVQVLGTSTSAAMTPVTSYPYRATGKLWARFGSSWFVCTASLIGKGILVTAAHCIHEYGRKGPGFANAIEWDPATYSTTGRPYGRYSYRYAAIPSPYYNGTDTCTTRGVVCNNDIAVIVLWPVGGVMPGNRLGWYRYGWNGYSFVTSPVFGNRHMAQISQLGYPVSHDGGYQMQRTDAAGVYYTSGNLKNTQIGSAQTGGSSGGPWLVNLGTPPVVSGVSRGNSVLQSVVGVTSYQSTTYGYNRLGSSWFGQNKEFPAANYGGRGAGNIGYMVNYVCSKPAYATSC